MANSTDFSFPLFQLVVRTSHIMDRVRQRELDKLGITLRNSAILISVIRLGDEATLLNIAEQQVLEVNSVSAQLARMEKDGLIEKVKDKKRKNLMHVRVTNKGYEQCIKGVERESINSIMSALTEEEQHNLWVIIAKLREQSMIELGKDSRNLYPPSDPADLPPPIEREGLKENILLNKPA